jgi:hypothetical protein
MDSFKMMILASYVISLVLDIYKSQSNPVYLQCKLPDNKHKLSELEHKRIVRIMRKIKKRSREIRRKRRRRR